MESIVEGMVTALTAYAAIGVLFAIAFLAAGIQRVDPQAKGSGLGFRLIIFSGVVALWLLLLGRWIRHVNEPLERNAHRDRARAGGFS